MEEWQGVARHFEFEEIPIPARHPESNCRMGCYRPNVQEEGFGSGEVKGLYQGGASGGAGEIS
jgi:hypothetical protein